MKLVIEADDNTVIAEPGDSFVIGRDPNAELTIQNSRVSRQHLIVTFTNNSWTFRDLDSANGTLLNNKTATSGTIEKEMTLRLGGSGGTDVFFSLLSPQAKSPQSSTRDSIPRPVSNVSYSSKSKDFRLSLRPRLRIGKAGSNDLVIDESDVSDSHAEITLRSDGGYSILDLDSASGVHVNGMRTQRYTLRPGDKIAIGSATLVFTGSTLESPNRLEQENLEVHDLSVTIGGKLLLDSISVNFKPASLTAILGPSGAGKSTMLSALTGQTQISSGTVKFGGWDLISQYDFVRQRIGLVPQADILHTNLTARQALTYAAQLRFPKSTSLEQIDKRVDKVLAELELSEKADLRVDALSGGQRKRASVALELLTEPDLLLLDEPTSGLDPGLDRQVMKILKEIAARGKTVVVVTHSTDNLDLVDDVLLLSTGGREAYFGSPKSALQTFGEKTWPPIFERLLVSGAGLKQTRSGPERLPQSPAIDSDDFTLPRQDSLWQLWVLLKRNLKVMLSDGPFFAFLVVLPFLMAAVGLLAGSEDGLSTGPTDQGGLNPAARSLLLVMVLAGVFIGASSSIQELVKERAIFAREKGVGLGPTVYITSKVIILSILVAFQSSTFTLITLLGRPLPNEGVVFGDATLLEVTVAMVLLGIVSMIIGLFVSAYSNSRESTLPVLVGVTMIQVVLSGVVPLSVDDILGTVSNAVPAFWSTNMLAATIDLNSLSFLSSSDEYSFWQSTQSNWIFSCIVLGVMTLVLLVATIQKSSKVKSVR
jgi:ABC-type multidrug transport system ATPase subunit